MTRRFDTVVKEIIIGFGFLNGLWFAVGTSPQDQILGFLNKHISAMPPLLQKAMTIVPLILMAITVITIISIYRRGRTFGIIAVLMGFLAGAVVLKNWQASLILLLASIVLGLISFKRDRR